MDDFLPGLVRTLEERFGLFGRILSRVVLLAACLWIILAALRSLVEMVIAPLISALQGQHSDVVLEVILWRIGGIVFSILGIAVLWAIAHYILVPRLFSASGSDN